jgi:hypothetical protein
MSLQAIGDKYGCSRERVRQILATAPDAAEIAAAYARHKAALPESKASVQRREIAGRRSRLAQRDAAIVEFYRGGLTQTEIMAAFGLGQTAVSRIIRRDIPAEERYQLICEHAANAAHRRWGWKEEET